MVSKLSRFLRLDLELSKRVRLYEDSDMDEVAHRHNPAGDIASIPVLRRQRRIPPHGLLPILPDLGLWFCPYGWEPFPDTLFQDNSGVGPKNPATPVRTSAMDVSDGSFPQDQRSCFGEVVPFRSFFQYASRYSDCPDVRRLVLGIPMREIQFVTRDGSAQRLTAAGN